MKKNIILIMCDQLRKDGISAYGNKMVHTPNIDKLVNGGMAFERAYVANPICMPNRNSVLSGRYPSNHGVWTNGILVKDCGKTLTAEIKKIDYQTANIGKMHLNTCGMPSKNISFESHGTWMDVPKENSFNEGYFDFDHVELTLGHVSPKAHYYKWFLDNGGKKDMFDVKYIDEDKLTGTRKMPARLSSSEFGVSFSNYIQGKEQTDFRDACLIEYRNGYGLMDVNTNVVVTDKFKYVRYETGDEELTDLSKDCEEKNNVVMNSEYCEIKCQLIEKMLDMKLKAKSKGDIQYGLS